MKTKAILCSVFFLLFSLSLHAEIDQLSASAKVAENWLKLVDQGKYADSWDTGSLTFQLTVPKNNWVLLMKQIRSPLGTAQTRKVLDQRTAKDPKGLPQGDYMVILYETTFSSGKKAHEMVTLVLESDMQWRVLTYIVQ